MRPDDMFEMHDGGADALLDADLTWLDDELADAGARARRAERGAARPSAAFGGALRQQLLAGLAADPGHAAAGGGATDADAGQAWAPRALRPRVAGRWSVPALGSAPAAPSRSRWALLAAAALTAVVAATAIGARMNLAIPVPTSDPSARATSAAVLPSAGPNATSVSPTERPVDGASGAPIVVTPSTGPTTGPGATPTHVPEPTRTPAATEPPITTPKPTTNPEPTQPPVGPMNLALTACPGGVVLDWTKPSIATTHYRSLRSAGATEVPSTYPADGATDVTTARASSGDVTSAFDETLDGGTTYSYRSFAFNSSGTQIAFSPYQTVATVGRIDLGTPTIENLGTAKFRFGWTTGDITASCFTSGRLVVSDSDPEPSWSKGSTTVAVITDRLATSNVVDSLPSGGTYWMRYEILRTTGTGSFIVARTSVIQVTVP